jgi:hypothetical protein
MSRGPLTAAAVLAASVALAAPLAGCGSSGSKIPRRQAGQIVARLDQAERRTAAHACNGVSTDTIPTLQEQVRALPSKTDSDIRATLNEGIDNLRTLIGAKCATPAPKKTPTTTDSTQTQPTTQTQTQPPTTTPTQTQTQPPTTTQTQTQTQPPTSPSGGVPPGQQKKGKKGKSK